MPLFQRMLLLAVPRQQVTCCATWVNPIGHLSTLCDVTSVNAACRQLSARSSLYTISTITSSQTLRASMLHLLDHSVNCFCRSASTTFRLCFCASRKLCMTAGLNRQQQNADDTMTLPIMTLITLIRHCHRQRTRNRISRGRRLSTITDSSTINT